MRQGVRTIGIAAAIALLSLVVWREYHLRRLYGDAQLLPFDHDDNDTFRHKHIVTLGRAVEPAKALPRYFKWKERVLVDPRSQGQCASCWAFSIADVMADRVSVHTGGKMKTALSAQELLSCYSPRWFTCRKGGIPEVALGYVVARGLLAEEAYPYENLHSKSIEGCKVGGGTFGLLEGWSVDEKRHEKDPSRIFAEEGSIRILCEAPVDREAIDRNIQSMKSEIFLNGPIIGTIYVYDDLYSYDADRVYEVGPGARLMGGHAIEIFGWADEGVNTLEKGFEGAYWICKNHWGFQWPTDLPKQHSGWFYVRMGVNMAGIESRASSADPLLTEAMKATKKQSTWLNSAYTSYDAYANDPERANFFDHLARRRRRRRDDGRKVGDENGDEDGN